MSFLSILDYFNPFVGNGKLNLTNAGAEQYFSLTGYLTVYVLLHFI